MSKKKKRKAKKQKRTGSKVMRVSNQTFSRLGKLKNSLTYDQLLEELVTARELIKQAQKIYVVDGTQHKNIDLTEARGISITNAVKDQRPPTLPKILLDMGYDDGFF